MKFNIEQYLRPIDQAFAEKKQQEVYMYYIMIVFLLFMFSYLLFWDSAEAEYNTIDKSYAKLTKKVEKDETYLRRHPVKEIQMIEGKIKNINGKIQTVQKQNEYITLKIEQIPELYYNEKTWGAYIDSIAESAKKYEIKIMLLSNRKAVDKEKFGHVLDINIEAIGNYANLMRFINGLEESKLVVDLHDMNISASSVLSATIRTSVWGITY